jgi:hypothetical protein
MRQRLIKCAGDVQEYVRQKTEGSCADVSLLKVPIHDGIEECVFGRRNLKSAELG